MDETPATTIDEPLIEIHLDGLPLDALDEWLGTMLVIREFEDSLEPLTMSGNQIPGGAHQASGQEAVAVGTMRALEPGDIVASPHRPHHHALAKGMTPRVVMAELWGRTTGSAGGRGGTMHLTDFSLGYFGSNGIVGAAVGVAMGAALAAKLRKTRSGRGRLHGRRRGQYRTNVGVHQLRSPPEAPADRLLREQPVRGRDVHRALRRAQRLHRGARERLRPACGAGRRPGRRRGLPRHARGARASAERAGTDVHRGGHLPLSRAQHRRGAELPRAGRGRAVAAHEGSDRAAPPRPRVGGQAQRRALRGPRGPRARRRRGRDSLRR